jgi:hypothetical protein
LRNRLCKDDITLPYLLTQVEGQSQVGVRELKRIEILCKAKDRREQIKKIIAKKIIAKKHKNTGKNKRRTKKGEFKEIILGIYFMRGWLYNVLLL